MNPQLGVLIADGIIKALLLGIQAEAVREAVRPLAPEAIPEALERMCADASARAHKSVDALPDDPAA